MPPMHVRTARHPATAAVTLEAGRVSLKSDQSATSVAGDHLGRAEFHAGVVFCVSFNHGLIIGITDPVLALNEGFALLLSVSERAFDLRDAQSFVLAENRARQTRMTKPGTKLSEERLTIGVALVTCVVQGEENVASGPLVLSSYVAKRHAVVTDPNITVGRWWQQRRTA